MIVEEVNGVDRINAGRRTGKDVVREGHGCGEEPGESG
jgi:hypothetical protein